MLTAFICESATYCGVPPLSMWPWSRGVLESLSWAKLRTRIRLKSNFNIRTMNKDAMATPPAPQGPLLLHKIPTE